MRLGGMKKRGRREKAPERAAELRRTAEEQVLERARNDEASPFPADAAKLVHELQVHQIELEMQNEELLLARGELEAALARYSDLYEFAPIGYFTLGRDGNIRKVNLTGARQTGLERARIDGRR